MSDKTTAPTSTELHSAISEEIRNMAAEIRKDITIGEGGVLTADKGVFEKTLPEGVTLADVTRVQGALTTFAAATFLATGEIGNDLFVKSKDLDRVSIEVKAGNDLVAADYKRTATFLNPKDKDNPITKFGILTPSYTSVASQANRGQIKKARAYLNSKAAELLG